MTSRCFGLTGGIASGKSTVASYFSRLGARTIDADDIAHELLQPPSSVVAEVLALFGKQILGPSGEIDRQRLGAIVFPEEAKRRQLERLLHPRIIARQEEMVKEYLRDEPHAVVLVEAALIYEAGISDRFSRIVVAWCAQELQIERLMSKAGLSRAEAEARIALQMPAEEKRRRADFVIDCSGSLEETHAQVESVYAQLNATTGRP